MSTKCKITNMEEESIGARIKRIRKKEKLTQKQVAEAVGVSAGAVTQWELDMTQPRGANLNALAYTLKSSPSEIIEGIKEEGSTYATKQHEIEPLDGFDLWDDDTPLRDDEVKVPIFTDVELSAGVGSCLVMETKGRFIRFSKRTLRDNNVDKSAAACAKVHGTSMEPLIMDGATVGIDTSKKMIKDGRIYAINHAGMMRVKYLYNMPGGGLRIRSFNQAEYPDETLTAEQLTQVEIIGFVFWWSTINKW